MLEANLFSLFPDETPSLDDIARQIAAQATNNPYRELEIRAADIQAGRDGEDLGGEQTGFRTLTHESDQVVPTIISDSPEDKLVEDETTQAQPPVSARQRLSSAEQSANARRYTANHLARVVKQQIDPRYR